MPYRRKTSATSDRFWVDFHGRILSPHQIQKRLENPWKMPAGFLRGSGAKLPYDYIIDRVLFSRQFDVHRPQLEDVRSAPNTRRIT